MTPSPQKQEEPKSALDNRTVEERQALILKKQRIEIKQLQNRLDATVKPDLQKALDEGDTKEAARLVKQKRLMEQQIATLQGQVANQEAAQRTLAAAQANKEQALLMRDGANRLTAYVDEAERIDVDDIVDTFQDAAERTHDMSSRLSEPIIPSSVYAVNAEGEDVDEEVERLMQRNAEAKTVGMPSAPAGGGGGAGVLVPPSASGRGGNEITKRVVASQKSLDAIKEKDY